MKKALIVILALLLLLGGLFFWKGGHHAIILADMIEEWLDEDTADQTLSLMVSIPGARVDEKGKVRPHIQQYSLNADTFWTEYADRPLFGLTAQGLTAWTDGRNLYMDTGKAYALPDLKPWRKEVRKLAVGMLLRGRITKQGDTYNLVVKTGELELDLDIVADKRVQDVSAIAILPNDSAVHLSITPKAASSHPVPREVADAIVRSKMEPPMALSEPLGILLPALESLIPLEGDLTLGVDCGILKLEETVKLRMDAEKAELERKGVIVTLDLPMKPGELEPLGAALLLLHSGEFTIDGSNAEIVLTLSQEITEQLCTALVPQIGELGMTFAQSRATVSIAEDKLTTAGLQANGEVPFLLGTIPLSFAAELNIH